MKPSPDFSWEVAKQLLRNSAMGLVFELKTGYGAAMKQLLRVGLFLAGMGLTVCGRAEVRLPADSPFQVILDRKP